MKKSPSPLFSASLTVLLMLIMFSEMGPAVEVMGQKLCGYKSKRFWGPCLRDTKCGETCQKEGFSAGDCKGVRRRCYCYKPCR